MISDMLSSAWRSRRRGRRLSMSRSDTTSPQSSKAATSTLAHPSHCTFTFPFRIPTAFIRLLFSSAIIRYSFQGISPYILPSFDLWSFARRLTNVDDTYESTSDTMVSAFKTCQAEGCGATWITFDDGVECPVCGFSEGVPPPQHRRFSHPAERPGRRCP